MKADRGAAGIACQLRHHRRQIAPRGIARYGQPVDVGAQLTGMLCHPLCCRPSIFDSGGVGMFGRQPVVQRHHHRAGSDRMQTRQAVVGVEVTDRPAATVDEHHHRRIGLAALGRPVHPDGDRARGSVDGAILGAQIFMNRAAGQVAESLPRCLDPPSVVN